MIKILLQIILLLSIATASAHAGLEEDMTDTGKIQNLPVLRELYKRAEAGDADYQLSLGNLFYKGEEVDQDFNEAIKWFRLSAEQGHPEAQLNLGILYAAGQVVKQDTIEAAKWFRLSAEQDNPQGQFNLGMLYDTGQGVPQNHSEAVKWYRKAAIQGLPVAQLNLGVSYVTGQAVARDEAEGLKWIRMAAEQNDAQAQFNLGVMYANGQGTNQDFVEAYRWAKLAKEQGHETAGELIKNLQEAMTPAQLSLAKKTDNPLVESPKKQSAPPEDVDSVYLQLGAFKTQSEANTFMQEMNNKLGNIGRPYNIYHNKDYYRVHVGPYSNKVEARRMAAKLKETLGFRPLLKQHN